MYKKIIVFLLSLFLFHAAHAEIDSNMHLRISLLTCGVGDELYASFGHTGVRVTDSARNTDIVFNYGTFNVDDPNFYMKFTRGKLLYYISYDDFNSFMQEYIVEHRKVQEQVLLLSASQKVLIYKFLVRNTLPDSMYYKYDFLFDNCATRIRDIFPSVLDHDFKFGRVLPINSRLTFRNILDKYLYRKHWERFGINLLLGAKVDRVMTNEQTMFLPDFLRDGVAGATVDGKRISTDPVTILQGGDAIPAGANGPFILMIVIALLTIIGLSYAPLAVLGRVMSTTVLLITGLLGCFILFMWFGTDHLTTKDNFNLLWALPTNILVAVTNMKGKGKYSLIAIGLLIVALAVDILRVQEFPLLQLGPLLVSLLFIYGSIYRKSIKPIQ